MYLVYILEFRLPSTICLDMKPIKVLEYELAKPLAGIARSLAPDGTAYRRARILVRLHSQPLGLVDIDLLEAGTPAALVADAIWSQLGTSISEHLALDGQEPISFLAETGIVDCKEPQCRIPLESFLPNAPHISVVIPTRERPGRLRTCLSSIVASRYPPSQLTIIVVDNAPSTTRTKRVVECFLQDGHPVRYAREDVSGGSSARNHGIRLVDSGLVAMTDDDVQVDQDWLAQIALTFSLRPDAACVSGLVVPTSLDTEAELLFEEYGGFTLGFSSRLYSLNRHRSPDPLFPWTAGVFGTGNNFSFRTDAIKSIGAFDPALGNGTPTLGGEDSELLLRTILSGFTIAYEPRALVHHSHRTDYASLQRQIHSYGVGLSAYYLRTLTHRPSLALDFLRKLPAGLQHLLKSGDAAAVPSAVKYPKDLLWAERRGILQGPLAYLKSRRHYGPHQVPLT